VAGTPDARGGDQEDCELRIINLIIQCKNY